MSPSCPSPPAYPPPPTPDPGPESDPRPPSSTRSRATLQEGQRLGVEFLDVLVDRRVRAVLEHQDLGVRDALAERCGEPGGGHQVVPTERDQGWSLDGPERGRGVVRQHRPGLADE